MAAGRGPAFDSLIPVREQSLGNFLYRGKGNHNPDPIFNCNHQDIPHMLQASGAMSYVTGAHAFKVGFENFWGTQIHSNGDIDSSLSYRFNNGIPNQITQRATPFIGPQGRRSRPSWASTSRTSGRWIG